MKKRITITDLRKLVEAINEDKTKDKNVLLVVSGAYGGYQVQLTGKYDKTTNQYLSKLRSAATRITDGFMSARETISRLYEALFGGKIETLIEIWN